MLKSLNRFLWNGVKRLSREQQRQGKSLVKSLIKASTIKPIKIAKAKAPRVKAAGAKSATTSPRAKPRVASPPGTVRLSKPRVGRALAPASLQPPGLWSRFYQSASSTDHRASPRRMEYWLYIPDGVKKDLMPLVVMLHGCEQSASQFAQGTRMNQLAAKKGFAVLYPQQSRKENASRCWNWYDKTNQDGGGEASMIVGVVQKVREKFPIDASRIYIGGMSAGAAMANIIALRHPQLIAAVGLHSGAVFGEAQSALGAIAVMQHGSRNANFGTLHAALGGAGAQQKIPAILIHGERDFVVRSVNMAHAAKQFRVLNQLSGESDEPVISEHPRVATASQSRNAYKTFDYFDGRKLIVRVCEIAQLDHAWSGGDCSLRFNACEGPDASLMMWNFFALHRRVGRRPVATDAFAARALTA
ncbi:PHB depolymerase family esterase [soil metagenome]